MKIFIGVGLFCILAALGGALYFLLGRQRSGHRMLVALRIRVALSVALLLFIWIGYWLGWIQPHAY